MENVHPGLEILRAVLPDTKERRKFVHDVITCEAGRITLGAMLSERIIGVLHSEQIDLVHAFIQSI